jgi:hypothetical protein
MKYSLVAAIVATVALACSPASATTTCLGVDMAQMTTMIGGMAEGPHKREMYGYLAMINASMARDGTCDETMMNISRGLKTSTMKSRM